jgi:hypothetical protein
LERVIRALREREVQLRQRLNRAHEQLQTVGEQMAAAFTQIDARTDAVVAGAEFRALAWHELDIEGAIALAIDHMTAKLGAANVALWLASSKGEFAMAGYGYYDMPRALAEPALAQIAREVCPALGNQCMALELEDVADLLRPGGAGTDEISGKRLLLAPLSHRGEVLGAVLLFRSQHKPWPTNARDTIAALSEAFAEQLDRIIRVTTRGPRQWPAMDTDEM